MRASRRALCPEEPPQAASQRGALLSMRYVFDGIKKCPHPEEAVQLYLEGRSAMIQQMQLPMIEERGVQGGMLLPIALRSESSISLGRVPGRNSWRERR